MTSLTNPTNLMDQVNAIDNLAKHATRTIRFDEASHLYVVEDKTTSEVIGRHENYQDARRAGH